VSGEVSEPRSWSGWYHFARDELGFNHDECVEYANLRYVEEQNRAALRERRQSAAPGPSANPGLHPG
jgi:hypothetical protein